MTDLAQTFLPKTDQLNADTLLAGPMTITVTAVKGCDDPTQPIAIHFEGGEKTPYKPCKSMRRVLVHCWGADGNTFVGRRMTLFCDPEVVFGGIKVGGIRISHLSNINREITMPLTASRAQRKPYTVKPITAEQHRLTPSAVDLPSLLASGRRAAQEGSQALQTWWKGLSKPEQVAAKPALESELKPAAAQADAGATDDDTSFGDMPDATATDTAKDSPPDDDFPGDRSSPSTTQGPGAANNGAGEGSGVDVMAWANDFLAWVKAAGSARVIAEAWAEAKRDGRTADLQRRDPDLWDAIVAAKDARADELGGGR